MKSAGLIPQISSPLLNINEKYERFYRHFWVLSLFYALTLANTWLIGKLDKHNLPAT